MLDITAAVLECRICKLCNIPPVFWHFVCFDDAKIKTIFELTKFFVCLCVRGLQTICRSDIMAENIEEI